MANWSKLIRNWLNLGAQCAKFRVLGGTIATEPERWCPYCLPSSGSLCPPSSLLRWSESTESQIWPSADLWARNHGKPSIRPNNNLHTAVTKAMMILIRALHNYTLQLWAGQNEVLHANDTETSIFVHSALNYHITQLYSLQSSFSPIIQKYSPCLLKANYVVVHANEKGGFVWHD